MHTTSVSDTAHRATFDLAGRPVSDSGRTRAWPYVLLAPIAGAALGAVSRGWMRLITDDPEFTWSGTIFIVLAFTITITGHAIAWAPRHRGRRRRATTPARIAGGVLTLPLFVGAGSLMLPVVVGASLATWRTDWRSWARVVAAVIAIPVPVMIAFDLANDGVTPRRLLGALLLTATYVVIVNTMRVVVAPIGDGWRMPRIVRAVTVAAGLVGAAAVLMLTVGIATGDM